MSPLRRRLFAWFAIAVFLVAATEVVLTAGGWQWGGWRQGFVRQGVIAISSSPRAVLLVNGQTEGQTPRRLTHLRPGVIDLELRLTGYQSWHRLIRIQPGQAEVIGPVVLFPAKPVITIIDRSTPTRFLVDARNQSIVQVAPLANGFDLQLVWPNNQPLGTLPVSPDRLALSPHLQLVVSSTGVETIIWPAGQPEDGWTVPLVEDVFWLSGSDSIVYGRQSGRLWQFDSVTKTQHLVGTATKAGPLGNEVWLATVSAEQTTIVRQSPFSTTAAIIIDECPGTCQVRSGSGTSLIIRQPDGSTRLVTLGLTGQAKSRSLGQTDQVFWSSTNEPPLWTRGVEIWTLDHNQQPLLLDRRSQPINQLVWVVPSHLLLVSDPEGLTISSVSSRQGRGVVFSAPLAPGQRVVTITVDRRTAVVADQAGLQAWRW